MNSKHTPGPWVEDGQTGSVWQGPGPVDRKNGLRIAVVDISTDRAEEDRANARLIAAAPELLAACKVLVDARMGPMGLSRNHLARGMDLALAAIAKATGGDQ